MFFIETSYFNSSHAADNNKNFYDSSSFSNQEIFQNEFEDFLFNCQYKNIENSSGGSSNSSYQENNYNYSANESNQFNYYYDNKWINQQDEWTRGNNTKIEEYQNNQFHAIQESEFLTVSNHLSKNKRKRVLNIIQRQEATIREKRRMLKLNIAFEQLRCVLPISKEIKEKISRVDTLNSAIKYIDILTKMLTTTTNQ
jgi:hypothetical protein